jgi:hypothetical protein
MALCIASIFFILLWTYAIINISEREGERGMKVQTRTAFGIFLLFHVPVYSMEALQKESPKKNVLTQREIGVGLGGLGIGLAFKRHPIIAGLLVISAAVTLTEQECDGIDELKEGVDVAWNAENSDEYINAAIQSGKGLVRFGTSLVCNGALMVHEALAKNKNKK